MQAWSFVETRATGRQWKKIHGACFGNDAYDPTAYAKLVASPDEGGRVRHFELREGQKCLGYAVLEIEQTPTQKNSEVAVIVLSYLGVDPLVQTRGVGSFITQQLLAVCRRDYPNVTMLLLEIDDRREKGLSPDEAQRRERLAKFYGQFGAGFWKGKHLRPSFLNKRRTFSQELCWIPLQDEAGDPDDALLRAGLHFILTWGYELTTRSAIYRRVVEQFGD